MEPKRPLSSVNLQMQNKATVQKRMRGQTHSIEQICKRNIPVNNFFGTSTSFAAAKVSTSQEKPSGSKGIQGTQVSERSLTPEQQQEIEHQYPFLTKIKTEPQQTNAKSFRLRVKRPDQFEDPKKLSEYIVVKDENEIISSAD